MSGRGNAAAMETTERFPQRLGNLAAEREIPTFPPPTLVCQNEERTEDWTESKRSGTLSAPADERNSGGKGFENPGSIPSENRQIRRSDPLTGISVVTQG